MARIELLTIEELADMYNAGEILASEGRMLPLVGVTMMRAAIELKACRQAVEELRIAETKTYPADIFNRRVREILNGEARPAAMRNSDEHRN